MLSNTCCFTGHRLLPKDQTIRIIELLVAEVDKLIAQGVTHFISGGALGFDLLAATVINEKRKPVFLLRCSLLCRVKTMIAPGRPRSKDVSES